jgi:hypothetical protein
MPDNATMLLALFDKYNTDSLDFLDYAVVPNFERAIIELENSGKIRKCDNVLGSIELI